MGATSPDVEDTPRSKIGYWLKWVKAAKKASKKHWEDSKAAYAEYELGQAREDDDIKPKRGFPIYWSCCKTLEPAYYSRDPKIISKRRNGIEDEMALTMSLIDQRLGQYLVETGHFSEAMRGAVADYMHGAKATVQVVYTAEKEPKRVPLQMLTAEGAEPTYYESDPADPYTEEVMQDDEGYFYNGEQVAEDTQQLFLAPVLFDEVLHTPEAKTSAEITEIAYKFCLDYEQAEAKFNSGKDKTLPYKTSKVYGEDKFSDETEEGASPGKKLEGWEIYCKHSKMTYWVCEEYKDDFLAKEPDPLGLKDFFPSPAFILQNKSRKSLYPTPTWVYLEATANQLHNLYERIFKLIKSIRRRALVYGASPELIQALNSLGDNEFIAAPQISDILDKGGIQNLIHYVPVQELVAAINEAMTLEEHFKNNFYEFFHVPDILRGTSDPAETASAQEIKSDAAHDSFKFDKKQITDLARNAAEMMVDLAYKVFSDEKIARIVGYEYLERGDPGQPPSPENPEGIPPTPGHYERFPEALARLRNDTERLCRIDFETDSTSFRDEAKETAKQQMISNTVLQGLAAIGGMQNPQFTGIALKLLLSVLESMGGSTQSEDMIKSAVADLEKARNAPPPPPPPDYESMKIQLKTQEVQMQGQVKMRELDQKEYKMMLDEREAQFRQQLEAYAQSADQQIQSMLAGLEAQRVQIEEFKAQVLARESMLEEQRLAVEVALENQKPVEMPEAPKPPQIITIPPPEMPAINLTFEMPKPGKKTGRIIRPDGTITEMEVEEAPSQSGAIGL